MRNSISSSLFLPVHRPGTSKFVFVSNLWMESNQDWWAPKTRPLSAAIWFSRSSLLLKILSDVQSSSWVIKGKKKKDNCEHSFTFERTKKGPKIEILIGLTTRKHLLSRHNNILSENTSKFKLPTIWITSYTG